MTSSACFRLTSLNLGSTRKNSCSSRKISKMTCPSCKLFSLNRLVSAASQKKSAAGHCRLFKILFQTFFFDQHIRIASTHAQCTLLGYCAITRPPNKFIDSFTGDVLCWVASFRTRRDRESHFPQRSTSQQRPRAARRHTATSRTADGEVSHSLGDFFASTICFLDNACLKQEGIIYAFSC